MTGRCPGCGHQVPAEAKFCAECGAPLAGGCAECGAKLLPGARFCAQCGTPVDTGQAERGIPGAADEGERRQLTVAYCDLAGAAGLAAQLDPEEFRELIDLYEERARGIVGEYGGAVGRGPGDALVCEFGWPEAHDDDPERAVRASLDLIGELQTMAQGLEAERRLAPRIGIHTALVVVGDAPGSGERRPLAAGEALSLAVALGSAAEPGEVVISAAARDLVPGIFVTEDLGTREVAGVAEAVRAFRAVTPTGVRSRLDAARGRLTPLVGREVELAVLAKRWDQARSRGGQAVLIMGEAGVGKSRLVYELRARLGGSAHSWLECRCSSYTEGSAFRPAIDLIEQGLQIDPEDPPAERLAKLERGLAVAGVASEDAVPLMATLLAIPVAEGVTPLAMSPERRRRRTIDVLSEWLLALARMQPLVLLVEDLHWSDPSSLELFGELLGQARGAELMLIGTARPEFSAPWGGRPNLTVLSVSPFSEAECRVMVSRISGERQLPGEVLERIVSETGGIPLFAEEVGRMVLESGLLVERGDSLELQAPLVELDIPMTLRGSLMARLDRLSAAKGVAQLAAVAGREFSYALLQEVAELDDATLRAGLDRLVENELLFEQGDPAGPTYTFKHALIQDAAYQSLLKRTRVKLHERIADALARRLDDDPLVVSEAVARHYEAAERIEPAVANYRRAAEETAERSGFAESLGHLGKAIELLGRLPESRQRDEVEVEMQLALGSAIIATRSYADAGIEAAYERALRLCQGLGDDAKVAHALAGLSIFYLNRGQLELGAELAERVLEIGQLDDDDELRLLGHVQFALSHILQARFAVGLEHAERATAIYDRERHHQIAYRFGTDHGVVAHCFAGWSLMGLGYLDQALERMRTAVELAESLGHPFSLAYALTFQISVLWVRGDADGQRETAARVIAIAEEQGFDLWTGIGHVYSATERAIRTGEESAIPEIIEGSLVAGETGNRGASTPIFAAVAEAQRAVGQLDEALGTVDAALVMSTEIAQPWWDSHLRRLKGELMLERAAGDLDAATSALAEEELETALSIAREQSSPVHELRAATRLAQRMLERGEREAAAALLEPVYAGFSEGFSTVPLAEAREMLSELGAEPAPPPPRAPGAAVPATADQAGSKPSPA
jgi:class 3 adenylate cyclase/tetratricopeptide (TPR) repeat protein